MSSIENILIDDIESQEYEIQNKQIIPIIVMKIPDQIVLDVKNRMQENERLGQNDSENDAAIIFCGKSCVILLFMILVFPILICDMYYAYNDDSCVNEYPKGLSINMKDYLLGCSYTTIIVMAIIICLTCTASNEDIKLIIIFINIWPGFILNSFSLIWHIIGASIFWGKLYPEHLCNKSPSTYFFISLIIKILLSTTPFFRSNKKE